MAFVSTETAAYAASILAAVSSTLRAEKNRDATFHYLKYVLFFLNAFLKCVVIMGYRYRMKENRHQCQQS